MPSRKSKKKSLASARKKQFDEYSTARSGKDGIKNQFLVYKELSPQDVGGVSMSTLMPLLNAPSVKNEDHLTTLNLHVQTTVSSDAGGTIATVFSNNPSTGPDWVNLAGSFDKYRVLGFRVKFLPNNRYSKTTTVTTPVFVVGDRDDLSALSSYSAAMNYESVRELSLEDPWSFVLNTINAQQMEFRDCLSSTANEFIKLYSTGLSVSTTYGIALVTWVVQFQGLGFA